MKTAQLLQAFAVGLFAFVLTSCVLLETGTHENPVLTSNGVDLAQIPKWSGDDLDFFLHGSMSTEVVPERVLQAFKGTYPELFPGEDLSAFGLIMDRAAGIPVGFSRREVKHLGGLSSFGLNCAACHVGEILPAPGAAPVRVLGMTSHLDAEAFFGAVTAAMFRTAEPDNMERFLGHYLSACDLQGGDPARKLLEAELTRQREKVAEAIASDPFASQRLALGALHEIAPDDLRIDRNRLERGMDLVPLVRSLLKLFHNMRAALHIPDQLPEKPPPPSSGPGRNDAFGLLSLSLFGVPTVRAPVKYGPVWNLEDRTWVHWDGNFRSPILRNLSASLGLGAPLVGKRGYVDFTLVKRHTDLSEQIRSPRYPFTIDADAAQRGARHYQARCVSCHDVARNEEDRRLHAVEDIKTDPNRARLFDAYQAELYNKFFSALEIPGYRPPKEPAIRSTQKYSAADLAGVWGRSPYLHNGSVRTMWDLLTLPASRPKTFRRGSRVYDASKMGYADGGPYLFDTAAEGNSNSGHDYGTDLSDREKRELIEYLKTR